MGSSCQLPYQPLSSLDLAGVDNPVIGLRVFKAYIWLSAINVPTEDPVLVSDGIYSQLGGEATVCAVELNFPIFLEGKSECILKPHLRCVSSLAYSLSVPRYSAGFQ